MGTISHFLPEKYVYKCSKEPLQSLHHLQQRHNIFFTIIIIFCHVYNCDVHTNYNYIFQLCSHHNIREKWVN